MRNPDYGLSNQVQHKPGCTTTEDDTRLEISDLESSENKGADQLCGYRELVWAFVFAYTKSRFSHDAAHIAITAIVKVSKNFGLS